MKKLGIAFGGGGGRGAYQIGVWKALIETGLDQQTAAVSGTSVGALNAALFLQGSYDAAYRIWTGGLSGKILIPQPAASRALKALSFDVIKEFAASLGSQGVFSREGLLQIIDENLNLETLSQVPVPYTVAVVDAKKNCLEYLTLNGKAPGLIKKALSASSAIPFVFPPETISGRTYVDGGVPITGDNCPIKPLADAGCDTVLALPLDRISGINRADFPYTRVVEIMPSNALWGFVSAFDGLLDFSSEAVETKIRLGYQDAMKILWENHLTDIIAFKIKKPRERKKNPSSGKLFTLFHKGRNNEKPDTSPAE